MKVSADVSETLAPVYTNADSHLRGHSSSHQHLQSHISKLASTLLSRKTAYFSTYELHQIATSCLTETIHK